MRLLLLAGRSPSECVLIRLFKARSYRYTVHTVMLQGRCWEFDLVVVTAACTFALQVPKRATVLNFLMLYFLVPFC